MRIDGDRAAARKEAAASILRSPVSFLAAAPAAGAPGAILLSALCLVVWAVPGLASHLDLDWTAVRSGEAWRVLTCHLTHWTRDQLGWDLLVLAILGPLCEQRGRRAFVLCMLVTALAIPAVLLVAQPHLAVYRGLSGLCSAAFVMLGTQILRESVARREVGEGLLSGSLLAGFVSKVGYEAATGGTVFAQPALAGASVVPLAHMVGALAGICAALWPPGAHPAPTGGRGRAARACTSGRQNPAVMHPGRLVGSPPGC